ncbi:MAG TPA: GTPase [Streptosporangiaceae bacterium]|nr:GTPase [Streptosporangiaceae bacterium]
MGQRPTGVPPATSPGPVSAAGQALSARLTAIARMLQIGSARGGPDGFKPDLLRDAEELLARVGERLRLSAGHTIVVLAGGTGSGKSSLFNALAGANFSPVGAVRPATREPLACVWGMEGAGPLLDWLKIAPRRRYARSSALDEGERALAGLLLIDMPDHDSVLTTASGEVSRLIGLADLMIWVLDPQKYADAAVHSRYLMPMASHSSVIAAVLNQVDLLAPEQVSDCEADLRRLLDSEGLHDAQIMVTSAHTGAGVSALAKLLTETVIARQAALTRISADVDAIAARFVTYAGGVDNLPVAGSARATSPRELPGPACDALTEAFSQAAGVTGIGRALRSARELRALDYLGWPVIWLAGRVLQHERVDKAQLGALWEELRSAPTVQSGAQQAEIDTAVTRLADEVGADLPAPWPGTVRKAARARAREIPAAAGAAVTQVLPASNDVQPWWRAVAAWQGLLLGAAAVSLAWLVDLIIVAIFGGGHPTTNLLRNTSLLPWVALLLGAVLLLGWLTATGCLSVVSRAAVQEREEVEQQMRHAIADVARQMVVVPVTQELSEYDRFREELTVARTAGLISRSQDGEADTIFFTR